MTDSPREEPRPDRLPRRQHSGFEEGVMAAAHHIETMHGDTGLRDEVLGLACLKLDDLRREYADD